MKWGSTKDCDNPISFWNRANFPSRWSTKKKLNTLSNFELKKYICAVSWKAIFSLVKDFVNWIERLRRTVIILVGSETGIIFHLGGLWKKQRFCQILRSKIEILLCSFTKSDIQSSEGLFQMKWGSTKESDNPIRLWNRANFPSRWSTKKVLNTLSNFELKKNSCAVSWKAIFSLMKYFVNWIERQRRTVIILVGSETEIIFHLGGLRKKQRFCQILRSKIEILLCSSTKSDIQSSEGLFQMKWGSTKECDNPISFWNRANFPSRWSTKKNLTRCQISSSKNTLVQFLEKRFSV